MNKKSIHSAPPLAIKEDKFLKIHNNTRVDPYYWMRLSDEQKEADNPDPQTQQVLDYLNKENDYTKACLGHTEQLQQELYDEIVGRIKKDDETVPYFHNQYWYYTRYEEGKEYPIYCRKKETLDSPEQILIDVNERAKGHDYFHIASLVISPDNQWMAFFEDTVSRRVYTIRFIDLMSGKELPEIISGAAAGGAWANDNQTFFYTSKNPTSLLSEKVWRHKIYTAQEKDVLVYHETDTSFYIGVYRSKSGKFIQIWNKSTTVSQYHTLDANHPDDAFRSFTPRESKHEYSIYHFRDRFYVLTNWDAINFRLMETPDDQTEKSHWVEVIAHRPDVLLEDLDVFQEYLVLSDRKDALPRLRVLNQASGKEHFIPMDEEAYIVYTSANFEFDTEILRYVYSSPTTPRSTFDYNLSTGEKDVKKVEEVVGGHDPGNYKVERKFVDARDGAGIPLTIVYRKETKLSTETPLLLYAYGSYGASMDPWFSSVRLSLLDRGFIFAIAHIRGGQELGRDWYEQGKLLSKKNTFYDFIDCASYLVKYAYTSSDHMYALGGSAGGLLMGAVMNLAPKLFHGIIAAVPFVDVVTTMLDETIPLTTNEFDEWGNPKQKQFYEYMLSYSPYDNVERKDYPNLLVTTGYFDSQVQYWEPAKWVAKLRDLKTDKQLLCLHTNMDAGHGGASGRFRRFKETALEYAFLLHLEGQV
jgi:oligopeptidase B